MERITEKQLQAVVDLINRETRSPEKSWITVDGKNIAQPGNYHLDWAYGGVQLARMSNTGGGVSIVISGFGTKRELYDKMHAFRAGLQVAK